MNPGTKRVLAASNARSFKSPVSQAAKKRTAQRRTRIQSRVEGPPSARTRTILLVDDVDEIRIATKWFLGNFGFTVVSARNAQEALALFDPAVHDVVITDNLMPGMSGSELAHVIKLRSPVTPVVMHSGTPPENQECLDLVIQRPTHLLELVDGVERLLAKDGGLSNRNPRVADDRTRQQPDTNVSKIKVILRR